MAVVMELINNDLLQAIEAIDKSAWSQMTPDSAVDSIRDWARRLAQVRDLTMRSMLVESLRKKTATPAKIIRDEIQQALTLAYAGDTKAIETNSVLSVLPDAPVSSEVVLPHDVEVSEAGTFVTSISKDGEAKRTRICPVPVVLTARLRILDDSETEELELAFKRDGYWRTIVLPRNIAFDSRKILAAVSIRGLPTTDAKARQIVKLLEMYESWNLHSLPIKIAVRRTGWHTYEGKEFFALGQTSIGLDPGTEVRLAVSPGEKQTLAAIRTKGTCEEWAAAVATLREYPRMMFVVYASLAAPLLKLTGTANFVVHNGGESSTGKTLASRVGASVWGAAGSQEGLVQPWDGTVNYATSMSALFSDLPIWLDDSQTERADRVQEMIFRLASGRDRGRLSKDATVRERTSSRNVAVTTGEQHLGDSTSYAGAGARLIAFWGGTLPPGKKDLADEIQDMVRLFYGQAGITYLSYVVAEMRANKKRISAATVRSYSDDLIGRMKNPGAIEGRIATYFGLCALAASLAHEVFKWDWDPMESIVECFSDAVGQPGSRRDIPKCALEEFQAWCTANRAHFLGGTVGAYGETPKPPSGGWVGVWSPAGHNDGLRRHVAIRGAILQDLLVDWGYTDAKSMIRHWVDRRYMKPGTDDHRGQYRVTFGDERPWMNVVLLSDRSTREGSLWDSA